MGKVIGASPEFQPPPGVIGVSNPTNSIRLTDIPGLRVGTRQGRPASEVEIRSVKAADAAGQALKEKYPQLESKSQEIVKAMDTLREKVPKTSLGQYFDTQQTDTNRQADQQYKLQQAKDATQYAIEVAKIQAARDKLKELTKNPPKKDAGEMIREARSTPGRVGSTEPWWEQKKR